MKILHPQRDTPDWMAAQVRKITESDAAVVCGSPDAENFKHLAETLFLDFCNIPRDPDTQAKILAFRTYAAEAVAKALAQYELLSHSPILSRLPGLLGHDELTWLACSPHGLTNRTVVHVIPRTLLSVWERYKSKALPRAVEIRCQVMMHVTGRHRADVIDFWAPRDGFDGFRRTEYEYDPAFIEDEFLPACTWLWQNVRQLHEAAFGSESERTASA